MESKFDITFRGDVIAGNNIVDVKQRLAQLFKIDAEKVDALFTGRAVPLKRNVDQATAEKYKAILMKAGAQVSLKDLTSGDVAKKVQTLDLPSGVSSSSPSDTSLDSPSDSPVDKAPAPKGLKKEQPLTLKERLARAAEEEKVLSKIKAKAEQKATSEDSKSEIDSGGFTLAPVGSVLGGANHDSTVETVDVDISHLTVKPPEGELLEPNEKKPEVVTNIDISDLDIAEVGADLIAASEKVVEEIKAIEISDFGLAEIGADLITAAEKPPEVTVTIADASFDLAPVGSDVGQIKKAAPPPPPDTSSLSLSD